MRFIDIYKEGGGAVQYVTGGCIQTGEPAVQRTPIVKSYVMADGTPLVYPAAKDTVNATVELECTRREAAAIEPLIRGAQILLAGAKLGAMVGYDAQRYTNFPPQSAIPCLVTGAAEIVEKYALSGVYSVRLPVQILVNTAGYPDSTGLTLPVIRLSALTLDGAVDSLSGYRIEKRRWNADRPVFFHRGRVLFTSASSLTLGYTCTSLTGDAVSVSLYRDGTAVETGTQETDAFTIPLNSGENDLVLEILGAQSRPLYVGLTAYRQNGG